MQRLSLVGAVFAIALLALFSPSLQAQTAAPGIAPELRERLTDLLARNCGVGEDARAFLKLIEEAGPALEPFFLQVLAEGAPEGARDLARNAAAQRFAERQRKLEKIGSEFLDPAMVDALRAVDQEEYIGQTLSTLDLTYRENALRGLEVVGSRSVIPAIRDATRAEPSLRLLSDQAIKAIESR